MQPRWVHSADLEEEGSGEREEWAAARALRRQGTQSEHARFLSIVCFLWGGRLCPWGGYLCILNSPFSSNCFRVQSVALCGGLHALLPRLLGAQRRCRRRTFTWAKGLASFTGGSLLKAMRTSRRPIEKPNPPTEYMTYNRAEIRALRAQLAWDYLPLEHKFRRDPSVLLYMLPKGSSQTDAGYIWQFQVGWTRLVCLFVCVCFFFFFFLLASHNESVYPPPPACRDQLAKHLFTGKASGLLHKHRFVVGSRSHYRNPFPPFHAVYKTQTLLSVG